MRIKHHLCWKAILLCLCALASLHSAWAAEEPPSFMASPDRALHAVAIYKAPSGESHIEIRRKGTVLWAKSYVSPDGQHGFILEQAQWTVDSQFFVFSLSSSGGHQSWRFPVLVYSRQHNALAPLEKLTGGPITSFDFDLAPTGDITVSVQTKDDKSKGVTVKLASLFAPKQ